MADYTITSLHLVAHASGLVAGQFAGPGWTDSARNVYRHVLAGTHDFHADINGRRFQLRAQRSQTAPLVAMAADGSQLDLASLAAALADMAARRAQAAASGGWPAQPNFNQQLFKWLRRLRA